MTTDHLSQQTQPSHVIAIGASAGGLAPIEALFTLMPPDSGAAFVIIQHLSREFDSLMETLMARCTDMPIRVATMNMEVLANHVYLNSPGQNLTISGGRFMVTKVPPTTKLHLPIDTLLNSLALERGRQAIAVILSGAGSDGSRGVRSIDLAGGMVVVQSPGSADFDSMPQNAIRAVQTAVIVRPEQIPAQILRCIEEGPEIKYEIADKVEGNSLVANAAIDRIICLLEQRFQIDFSAYKMMTLERRIEQRMVLTNFSDLELYANFLHEDEDELNSLYRYILVDVTHFFRDSAAFTFLAQEVITEIIETEPVDGEIRIWVAGCASGEEAYSLGIMLVEELERQGKNRTVRIFATDAHQESIDRASLGIYSAESCAPLSSQRLQRFFTPVKDGYQVIKQLREMMIFAHQDLLESPPFTRMDLVSCRNVLIYFRKEARQRTLAKLHFALKTEGILFLGPSEHLGGLEDEFETIQSKWRIFRKRRDVILPNVDISMPMAGGVPIASKLLFAGSDGETPANDYKNISSAPYSSPLTQRASYSGRHKGFRQSNGDSWMEPLLSSMIPSGLVLDQNHDIYYIFGDAHQFLHLQLGYGTLNAFDLIEGELVTALRLAVAQIMGGEKKIVIDNVQTTLRDGNPALLKATIIDITANDEPARRIFVGFQLLEPDSQPPKVIDMGSVPVERVEQLEYELAITRETLQATVEEQEATNEELSAANEEMQASNEELSATNEELYTVNTEYQRTIGELTQLTADMENLQSSTQIGVLFLDAELIIRQFTPPAGQILGLVDADVGRPISKLTFFNVTMDVKELETAIQSVIEGRGSAEIESKEWESRSYLVRILPYINEKQEIEGVVLTLIDVSARKERDLLSAQIEQFYEVMAGLFVVLDTGGNVTRINPAGLELLDFREEELLGQNWFDTVWPAETRVEARARHRRMTAGEILAGGLFENDLVTKSGQRISVLRQTILLYDADGQIVGTASSGYDVSSRKKAELALQKRTNQLRTVIDNIPAFVAYLDPEMRYRFANRRYAQIGNVSTDELVGQHASAIIGSAAFEVATDSIQRVLTGETVTYENQLPGPDGGDPVHVQATFIPEIADGEVVGVFVLGVDITEVRRQSSLIEAISETNPGFTYLFSLSQQRNLYLNREVGAELGYTIAEVQEMGERFLPNLMHPDDWTSRETLWQAVIDSQPGEVIKGTYRLRHKDGRWRWFMCQELAFRRDQNGSVLEILGSGIDITELKEAEETLRATTHQLRTITDNLPGWIAYLDRDYRFQFANKYYDSATGIEVDSMIGKLAQDVLTPEGFARSRPQYDRALAGETVYFEKWTEANIHDGEAYVGLNLIPDVIDDEVKGIFVLGVDITKVKLAELALAQSEARYRAVVDSQSAKIIRYRADDYTITFVNPAFCRFWGREVAELLGQGIFELIDPANHDEYRERLDRIIKTGQSEIAEGKQVSPVDGLEHWLRRVFTPIHDDDGTVVEIQVVGVDLTERKKTELANQKQAALLKAVLNASPDALLVSDVERRFTIANPAAEHLFGYSADELIGQPSRIIYTNDKDHAQFGRSHFSPSATEVLQPYETVFKRKDGSTFAAEVIANKIIDPDQNVIGFVSAIRDVSEHKRITQSLEERTNQLLKLTNALPAYIGYVDSQMNYRYVNENFARLLGAPIQEIVGQPLVEVHKKAGIGIIQRSFDRVLKGKMVTHTREVPDPDGGKPLKVQVTLVPETREDTVVGIYSLGVVLNSGQQEVE